MTSSETPQWLLGAVAPLAERFTLAGHELYLVGGVVRDMELGRHVEGADLDCTTDARPEQTLALLEGLATAIWRQGERFGTIGAKVAGYDFEVTTFRADAYDPTSRKPVVTFGDSIRDDLARRDFTVNAMALRLPDLVLIDPFLGKADLGAGVLRTPLAPEISFSDDPLRMLRAARFAAGYGLRPTSELTSAARQMADRLGIVSVERVWQELSKLLRLPDPSAGLDLLVETGLSSFVVAELAGAGPPGLARVAAAPPDPVLRLVALLQTEERVRLRLRALRASSAELDRGTRLARWWERLPAVWPTDPDAASRAERELLVGAGPVADDLLELLAAVGEQSSAERLGERAAAEPDLVDLHPPLDGDAVMARLGLDPGPEVGAALAALREARLAGGPLDEATAFEVLDGWFARRTAD